MDWIPTCVVVFGAGALFGLALGLFMIGEIEGKLRGKKEVKEEVTLLKARVDCLEQGALNQLQINENQGEINQFQSEMNEHLSRWICTVEKKMKK